MKAHKSKYGRKGKTRPVGLRLDEDLVAELKQFAVANERDLTWVLIKSIRIGWPIFRDQRAI